MPLGAECPETPTTRGSVSWHFDTHTLGYPRRSTGRPTPRDLQSSVEVSQPLAAGRPVLCDRVVFASRRVGHGLEGREETDSLSEPHAEADAQRTPSRDADVGAPELVELKPRADRGTGDRDDARKDVDRQTAVGLVIPGRADEE